MTFETILYNSADSIATITLNRPNSLNSLSPQLLKELHSALKMAGRDKSVRTIVLTGAGRGFSSGAYLSEEQPFAEIESLGNSLRDTYNKVVTLMTSLEKPILGVVNGVCAGAGFGIALACDMRIASQKASFIQIFTRIGLVPDSGSTWFLPRLVGYGRAFELMTLGDRLSAETALQWGIVNQVVPHNELAETADILARRLASGPTVAYGLTKRALNRGATLTLEQSLEYEAKLQDIAQKSADVSEGVSAFLEKRQAKFEGK